MKIKQIASTEESKKTIEKSEEQIPFHLDRKNYNSSLEWWNAILPYIENLDEVAGRKPKTK